MTTTNITTTNDMRKNVKIDFMFVDLHACTRCRGTNANLATALDTVRRVLEAADPGQEDAGRFRAEGYETGLCLVADDSGQRP